MDKFRIDSHKLIYHVPRVNAWLAGKAIYPLYIEISPSGICNHRCIFCAYDFVGYKPNFLDTSILKSRLGEMASLGVKSVLYSGEGEPLLHKDISAIVNYTRRSGIDTALASNGVLLDKSMADSILGSLSWIKISMNAGTKKTYASIHRAPAADFDRVVKNLSYAARLKRQKKYECAIGIQILLLPENSGEIVALARKARDIGADYVVVKPYSQHPLSITRKYEDMKYSQYLKLADKLKGIQDKNFEVIFRTAAMKKWDDGGHSYKHCYALPFWAHIDSAGTIWGCPVYFGDERFNRGNIYKNTFKQIWRSAKRKELENFARNKLNIRHCRVNCRMDEINRYLWELKNPSAHVNFI
ncbi:MAG: radical SAM protein [Candidatus Omnitrophota bacterium]